MCFICGRSSCCESFHTVEEQERFAPAIELYEKAIELREKIRNETSEDEGVRYNICGLPTVIVLKSGQEVGRIDNGVTKQAVIDLIRAAKGDD